jgi:hypothetical protein
MIQMSGLLSDGYLQGESLARGQKLGQAYQLRSDWKSATTWCRLFRVKATRLGNAENGARSLTDKVSAEMESVRQLIRFRRNPYQMLK